MVSAGCSLYENIPSYMMPGSQTFFVYSTHSSRLLLNRVILIKPFVLHCQMADTASNDVPQTKVTEGKAEIIFPSVQDVFYNPVQEFNRDMSVAVLRLHTEDCLQNNLNVKKLFKVQQSLLTQPGGGIRILEALAASGLRSIRYALEVPRIAHITANDMSFTAVSCMQKNIEHNNVENIVHSSQNDAKLVMYEHCGKENQFHAVDIDPYGSPQQFLDGAVQCVTEGGLLMVTSTDLAVLCGNSPDTCYAKYMSVSVKSKACHEIALRILLRCIESHANQYGRYIVPLLSISADFYIRVFVRIYSSQLICKQSFTKVSWLYHCTGCEAFSFVPLGRIITEGKSVRYKPSLAPPIGELCPHCDHRNIIGGPIWTAPIHDPTFVSRLFTSLVDSDFATFKRMYGCLSMIKEELPDVPLYYVMDKMASVAGVITPKLVHFYSAILNAGYRVSMSHACRGSIKTDAPAKFLWDILRTWEKANPANLERLVEGHTAKVLLQKPVTFTVNFDMHPNANPNSRKNDLLRFQINPERNWGPKSRAKTSIFHNFEELKRIRNQGKKRHSRMESENNKKSKEANIDGKDDIKLNI